mmetsp:Transcript_39592/g.86258  ORF Transcript_39592/g.86258 Transcript_39592/m.86258 type:complete len:300 (-) Transcript_39592:971-1870(-)
MYPPRAARCSAVHPLRSSPVGESAMSVAGSTVAAAGFAPAFRRVSTTAAWPRTAAACSAVAWWALVPASSSAWLAGSPPSRACTTVSWPLWAARNSAVWPETRASGGAPRLRVCTTSGCLPWAHAAESTTARMSCHTRSPITLLKASSPTSGRMRSRARAPSPGPHTGRSHLAAERASAAVDWCSFSSSTGNASSWWSCTANWLGERSHMTTSTGTSPRNATYSSKRQCPLERGPGWAGQGSITESTPQLLRSACCHCSAASSSSSSLSVSGRAGQQVHAAWWFSARMSSQNFGASASA